MHHSCLHHHHHGLHDKRNLHLACFKVLGFSIGSRYLSTLESCISALLGCKSLEALKSPAPLHLDAGRYLTTDISFSEVCVVPHQEYA